MTISAIRARVVIVERVKIIALQQKSVATAPVVNAATTNQEDVARGTVARESVVMMEPVVLMEHVWMNAQIRDNVIGMSQVPIMQIAKLATLPIEGVMTSMKDSYVVMRSL